MRIALTGATGLLGRNLFFEIIKQNLTHLNDLEILILGRPSKNSSLKDRIIKIIETDGLAYLGKSSLPQKELLVKIAERISPITFELTKEKLNISDTDINELKKKKIDLFFHLAALSDFRTDPATKEKLNVANIIGTTQLLELIGTLNVGELVYTGSAYSCGDAKGVILPDYINKQNHFRNFYEESKLLAEINVRDFCGKKGLKHRIFRPVGIVGRLIEPPIGSTSKFDLFYEWAAFFFREKLEQMKTLDGIFEKDIDFPIRIARNKKSGMNFVTADYAAKIMHAASSLNDPNVSYHLSSDENIPHNIYLPIVLKELGISGYELVDKEPENPNKNEKLYYKSVGKIFTPYLLFENPTFDNSNLTELKKRAKLTSPKMTEDNFKKLLKFAKDRYFGLSNEHLKHLEVK